MLDYTKHDVYERAYKTNKHKLLVSKSPNMYYTVTKNTHKHNTYIIYF